MVNNTRYVDATGQPHPPAGADTRIVSLVPSVTELLFELGLGPRVVGRTGFCIHPRDAVREVQKVGGTKDVKLDAVRALAPTHVIVNVDENDLPMVDALREFVAHVVVTHPNAPADNIDLYRLLGGIFGAQLAAERLVADLRQEIAVCQSGEWSPEKVLYLIWQAPWMTIAADTYIARTLALVGWMVPAAAGGWSGARRYPVIDDLAAMAREVDRVLLSSEPYAFGAKHVAQLRGELGKPVDLIDGEMTSWYGSRAIRGLAYLRWFRQERSGRGT
jgi:ABC-type Fe3+-hydroxamate transport system substrate-binding protein